VKYVNIIVVTVYRRYDVVSLHTNQSVYATIHTQKIILQVVGHSRPVPIQNLTSELYETLWTFGRTPWTGDQPDARPLPKQDSTTQKERGHTSTPRAVFEPAIPVFEQSKTVRASDRAAVGTRIYSCVCVCVLLHGPIRSIMVLVVVVS